MDCLPSKELGKRMSVPSLDERADPSGEAAEVGSWEEPGASSPEGIEEKIRRLCEMADRESAAASFEEALHHYRAALALGSAESPGILARDEEAQLFVRIARCLLRLGRPSEALRAVEGAAGAQSPEARLEVAAQWSEIYVGLGDYRRAHKHAHEARDILAQAAREDEGKSRHWTSWLGKLHNLVGRIAARRGDSDAGELEFERAVAMFRRAGDLVGLASAFNNLGVISKNRCQWTRAREYFTVCERLISEGEEKRPFGGPVLNLGIVHLKLGEWKEAASCFEKSLDLSTKRGDIQNQVRALLAMGDLFRLQRDFARAEKSVDRAIALAEAHQYMRELSLGLKVKGELACARHRLSEAQGFFDRAEAVAGRIAPEGDLITELARLRAELALRLGDGVGACERAQVALARAERQGDPYEEALSQGVLARALDVGGETERAREAHLRSTNRLRDLGARHPLAEALVSFAAHSRRQASERGESRGLLREALTHYEECGDSLGPAMVRLEGARLELAAGRLDAAVEYLAWAGEVIAELADEHQLDSLRQVEAEVEEAMVGESLAARRVASRARGEAAPDLLTADRLREQMSSVIEGLTVSTGAAGALIALRRGSQDKAEVVVSHAIPEGWARDLMEALPERIEESMAEQHPLVVLDARRPGAPALPHIEDGRPVSSFIVIPLSLPDGARAFLYLDRLHTGDGQPLGQKDLNLGLTVAGEVATLVTEMGLREKSEENLTQKKGLRERLAFADVVTQSREMLEILRLVGKVGNTSMTVLIQGETGTGKQLIARALHATSDRRDRPFVTIDCAALPENLLESELFGYRRGAFTGATQDRKGLAEEADRGTIFLDEIGKAGLGVQQRLLHLLDCGEIRAVGATSYRQLDVRVICATSTTDLRHAVEEGRFLKDLYYRLNDFAVVVPPLKERREDVLLLAEYFLNMFSDECHRPMPELTRPALRLLLEYDWPGNVRELQKVMRRAAVLADEGEAITPELLPPEIRHPERMMDPAEEEPAGNLKDAVEIFERRLILATLDKVSWNKSRAAQELGLSRKGLRNKISRMELERHGRDGGARSQHHVRL